MSGGYTPGTINAGAIIGAKTLFGTATNGTTVLGTVGAGKTWYVIAVQLTAEHDNLGVAGTASVVVDATTALTLRTAATTNPVTTQQAYPVGYGLSAAATKTITVVSPNTDIRAEALVTYIEV